MTKKIIQLWEKKIMRTDNLNQMISSDLEQHMQFIEIDHSLSGETMDTVDGDSENEIIHEISATEILAGNYEPESEEALIAYAVNIHARVQTYSISGYWEIGRSINAFYKGKYGTNELERIAKATGIGRDTLAKSCKFAKQYSKEHVETLLKGNFVLSWGQIAKNLTIEPQKVIEVYRQSPTCEQFYYGIIKLKDPSEARGKNKRKSVQPAEIILEPSVNTSLLLQNDTGCGVDKTGEASQETSDLVDAVKMVPENERFEREIKDLQEANDKLHKELDHTKYQLNEMNSLFHDAAIDITKKGEMIDRLRATLNQVYEMVQNGCDHANILEQVTWRI